MPGESPRHFNIITHVAPSLFILSGLGTHVSFVRSVKMDSWTEAQVQRMKHGGNQRCKEFLVKHGVDVSSSIKDKYDTPATQLYQRVIKARVAGEPEPTELPSPTRCPSQSGGNNTFNTSLNRPMTGFGSSPPPPPPSNTLKVRERMAAAGAYIQVLRNDATSMLASHKQRLREIQSKRNSRRNSVLQSLASFRVAVEKQ